MSSDRHVRTGYVVKVYPRFSETFVVTEIMAREAAGEDLAIYATRPTTDARFHPQIAQVQAPVTHLIRPARASQLFSSFLDTHAALPHGADRLTELMPLIERCDVNDVANALELTRLVLLDGIDHLHAHFANAAARVAAIAAHLTGITWSVTTHAKDLFHESVDESLLEQLLTRADTVVTISDFNRRHLLRRFPGITDHVALVRNGIDLTRFPYHAPRPVIDELRVLAVGRIVEKKGFDVLVEATRQLRDAGTPLSVKIAGDGELAPDLRAQVTEAGLEDVVELLGPRSQAEVTELLQWADVMAAPCVVGRDGNADGLPTVLLEAMAMGVLAVSTSVTGIPEAVHPAEGDDPATGLLLEPGNVEDLASALGEVASHSFPREEMARSARYLIERDYDTRRQSRRLAEATTPATNQEVAA